MNTCYCHEIVAGLQKKNSYRDEMLVYFRRMNTELEESGFQNQPAISALKEWVKNRKETHEVMGKILWKLNRVYLECSKVGDGSCGAGFAGSVCAASAFCLSFIPAINIVEINMLIYGLGVGIAGLAAAGGVYLAYKNRRAISVRAYLADRWISRKYLNEFNAVLDRDHQTTQQLCNSFKRADQIRNHFETIFGPSEIRHDVFSAVDTLDRICSLGGETLEKVIEALRSGGDQLLVEGLILEHIDRVLRHMGDTLRNLFLEFCRDPALREAVKSICNAYRNIPVTNNLNEAKLGLQLLDSSMEPIIKFLPKEFVQLFQAASPLYQGKLLGISLAISVWAFVSSRKDIKDKSMHDELLRNTQNILQSELECLYERFPELREE